jgi:hypothetical protein
MERQSVLGESELDLYIRSLMWLPSELRQNCLEALEQHSKKRSFASTTLRQALIAAANSTRADTN